MRPASTWPQHGLSMASTWPQHGRSMAATRTPQGLNKASTGPTKLEQTPTSALAKAISVIDNTWVQKAYAEEPILGPKTCQKQGPLMRASPVAKPCLRDRLAVRNMFGRLPRHILSLRHTCFASKRQNLAAYIISSHLTRVSCAASPAPNEKHGLHALGSTPSKLQIS